MIDPNYKGTSIELLHDIMDEGLFNEFEPDCNYLNYYDCWLEHKSYWGIKLNVWAESDGAITVNVDNAIVGGDLIKNLVALLRIIATGI